MKKLVMAVLLASFAISAQAADPLQASKMISVSFVVDSVFGLQIWDTEYTKSGGTIKTGEAVLGDIHFYATSNRGKAWNITAASQGAVGQGASPVVLPIKFTTYGDKAGGSKVQDLVLTSAAQKIYTSTLAEGNAQGLEISGIYVIKAEPEQAKADNYSASIILTMTE